MKKWYKDENDKLWFRNMMFRYYISHPWETIKEFLIKFFILPLLPSNSWTKQEKNGHGQICTFFYKEWYKPGTGGWKKKRISEGGWCNDMTTGKKIYAKPQYRSYWQQPEIFYKTTYRVK